MSEITTIDNSTNLPEKIDIETFKSVYYWLNAKPDTHIKIFQEGKLISINDILQLNNRIQKKLENYDIKTTIISIVVTLANGESLSFNAWEVFKNNSWEIPETTSSISINWDISVKLPNYTIPQKHSLKVRIGSSLRPKEIFQIWADSESELELQENLSFVVCKVDFINVLLSKELLNIVEEWYKCLQKNDRQSTWKKIFEKGKDIFARTGHVLTISIGLIILYIIFKVNIKNLNFELTSSLYLESFFWMLLLFIFYSCFDLIGKVFGNLIYEKVNSYENPHFFMITKGDQNKQNDVSNDNKKISNNLFWQFLIRLTVAIISLFISKYV